MEENKHNYYCVNLNEGMKISRVACTFFDNVKEFYQEYQRNIDEYRETFARLNRVFELTPVGEGFMIQMYLPRRQVLSQIIIKEVTPLKDDTQLNKFMEMYFTENLRYEEN